MMGLGFRGRGFGAGHKRPLVEDEGSGCRGCLMQDGCSGSQRPGGLQTRVREEIQLVAELPNVKGSPHDFKFPPLCSKPITQSATYY